MRLNQVSWYMIETTESVSSSLLGAIEVQYLMYYRTMYGVR
jgi:hypothetical protein